MPGSTDKRREQLPAADLRPGREQPARPAGCARRPRARPPRPRLRSALEALGAQLKYMLAIYPVCLRVLLVLAISLGAAGSSRGDVAVPRHQSAPNDELALAILRDCFEERKAPDIKVLDSAEAFLVEANDALPLAVAARRIEGKRVIVATQSELRLQAKARGRSIYYLRIEIATRTKSRVTIRRLA